MRRIQSCKRVLAGSLESTQADRETQENCDGQRYIGHWTVPSLVFLLRRFHVTSYVFFSDDVREAVYPIRDQSKCVACLSSECVVILLHSAGIYYFSPSDGALFSPACSRITWKLLPRTSDCFSCFAITQFCWFSCRALRIIFKLFSSSFSLAFVWD